MGRYLLTGAAGFIGSRVARELLAAGNDLIGLDNLNDAYDPKLKEWRLARLRDLDGFEFIQADICDDSGLDAAWGDGSFDAVINLAARAGVRSSLVDPWAYTETNVRGTLNLLDRCRRSGVTKFVQASTSSLYGDHNPRPFREDADTGRPLSPYAASKGAAELLCHSYHHLHGLDITILRYFTVFGPAGRPDMSIFRFVQWIAEGRPVVIYGDGTQERDFTHIDDIARGTVAALRPLGYEIINLGSDRPLSLMDVIHKIEQALGKEAAILHKDPEPTDIASTWADIHKAGSLLGWEPRMDMDEGLQGCVAWYLHEREWARKIDTAD